MPENTRAEKVRATRLSVSLACMAALGCAAGAADFACAGEPVPERAPPGVAAAQPGEHGGIGASPAARAEVALPPRPVGPEGAPDGIVVEVAISPRRPHEGEPVAIILSTRNVGDRPLMASEAINNFPRVFMRDGAGRSMLWTEQAPPRWRCELANISEVIWTVRLNPGCAFAESRLLTSYFGHLRPGRYTGRVDDQDMLLPAVPFTFEVQERGKPQPDDASARKAPRSRGASVIPANAPFPERWKFAEAAARGEDEKLMLEATPRSAGGELSLAISLKNISAPTGAGVSSAPRDPHAAGAVAVEAGRCAADYELLVRDGSGREVRPRDGQQGWWAEHSVKQAAVCYSPSPFGDVPATADFLMRGEAVGVVIPLSQLYPLKAGMDYEAIVLLPKALPGGGALAAGPIQLRR